MQFEAPLPQDMYYLLSVLRLQAGMNSSLQSSVMANAVDDEDDWNEDDYDVEVIYMPE